MPTLKPWDIMPTPEQGAGTADELYLAVGEALSNWEAAEESLAEMFAVFVGGGLFPGQDPAIRAYGSVISFNSRAEMLDAAAQAYFRKHPEDPIKPKFKGLLGESRQLAGRRNDIAHGRVHFVPGRGYFLYPGLYNTRKNPIEAPAAYCWGATQVQFYREQFHLLADKLEEYAVFNAVWTDPEPPHGSSR